MLFVVRRFSASRACMAAAVWEFIERFPAAIEGPVDVFSGDHSAGSADRGMDGNLESAPDAPPEIGNSRGDE
jgi:hypothetical protein